MRTKEARTRFFFFCNSVILFVACLLGTPTGATAPNLTHEDSAGNHVSSGIAMEDTAEAPRKTQRKRVTVSRDAERIIARSGKIKVTARDMELLARLVYAEGRGEPYEGQVAIAAVVLNRVESPQFPNTVREVIFAPNAFSPVKNGKLPAKTDETARRAVRDAVNGKDPSKGALYFFNPKTATSSWIWSRSQAVRIENHIFCR
ncbi:cell wall hydrolase [Brevibacillus sp. H7]|uniref:cell wall hydrolase n=1 Tax=Brevibacillus sp. H7 TaxID=3349138 RepID=UPI00380689CD